MSNNDNEYGYLEIQCTNSKCNKITTFRIAPERCNCSACNTPLPLKRRSSIKNLIKISCAIGAAATIGYSVADEFKSPPMKSEVIQIFETMNACMKWSHFYKEQRDFCACAFIETYEDMKLENDFNNAFKENLRKCYEKPNR